MKTQTKTLFRTLVTILLLGSFYTLSADLSKPFKDLEAVSVMLEEKKSEKNFFAYIGGLFNIPLGRDIVLGKSKIFQSANGLSGKEITIIARKTVIEW